MLVELSDKGRKYFEKIQFKELDHKALKEDYLVLSRLFYSGTEDSNSLVEYLNENFFGKEVEWSGVVRRLFGARYLEKV